jgi:hypothetical protein
VFGAEDAEEAEEGEEAPPAAEKGTGREGPRPVPKPRPGFAGGTAEMRGQPPERR